MRHILLKALLVHSGGDIFILMAHGVSGGHAVHDTGPAALQNAVKIFKNIQTEIMHLLVVIPTMISSAFIFQDILPIFVSSCPQNVKIMIQT